MSKLLGDVSLLMIDIDFKYLFEDCGMFFMEQLTDSVNKIDSPSNGIRRLSIALNYYFIEIYR